MSATIIQAHRALRVLPSDNADIPFPAVAQVGRNTSVVANQLIDTAATFNTNFVRTGDIVYNTTDGTAATVVSVTNQTTLVLNADIFLAINKDFIIYQASAQTTIGNQGCVLYIGGAGNVAMTTNGSDVITFVGLNTGQFVPVQAVKVALTGTTATNIIALW
tara:strand:- start:6 stop:491 length:486 start_codon:yes stop_codon:yes gene_type:complete